MKSNHLKIGYVTMQYPVPSETFSSNDICELLNFGHTIDILCLRPKPKNFKRFFNERHSIQDKISVYHINFYRFILSVLFIFFNFLDCAVILYKINKINGLKINHTLKSYIVFPSIINIFLHLRKNKPDIVHLFWGHYPSIIVLFFQRFKLDINCTMFLGANDLETKLNISFEASKFVKKVFTHSHSNLDTLISNGVSSDKIIVLHRGVTIEKDLLSAVENKKINKKKTVFLTAGRLIKEKGVDDVIDIFNCISDIYPNIYLHIAGSGPLKKTLIKKVFLKKLESKVTFLGHISQKELFKEMIQSDFFILMSKYKSDRLPNVLKEAMLRKCICITTNTQGIDELITHCQNGYIFDNNNDVIEFIKFFFNTNICYSSFLNNAHQTILQNFDARNTMINYNQTWSELLN